MKSQFVLLLAVVGLAAACDITWPNNTDTTFHWWQCNSGPINFFNATPFDQKGQNYEYPIHLGAPIVVKTDLYAPHTYESPNLKNTVNVWTWGGFADCTWSALPTLGLLKNLDACTNGIPCPVQAGRQYMNVIIDFTKFNTIIDMLKDNAPYQLEYLLHDKKSGDDGCMMVQARARIP